MPNRSTRIKFPVFNGYEVRLIIARDVKATGRRLQADLDDCLAAVVTHAETPKVCWLILGPKATDAGSIAHECSHAVRRLFECAGVRHDEEAFAYHLDYLVGKVHKFLGA